jgi:tetratricopeptide (TPR) repeat protein
MFHVTNFLLTRLMDTTATSTERGTAVQDPIESEAIIAQLNRIVKNPPLESSPSLCRFLRYVVEETVAGRSGSLKEYSLGVVVFDRGESFDPRLDPIVRVQARNLRVRLTQYYATTGSSDPVVIDLPKRTYVPVFRSRAPEVEEKPAETPVALEAASPPALPTQPVEQLLPRERAVLKRLGAVVIMVLLVASGATGVWNGLSHWYKNSRSEPDRIAQELYIRGRYVMDRQTEAGLREGVEAFRQAIARDPNFAPAYTGLADAYNILAQYGYIAPSEGMEQARRAARKALEIDPRLAEAHVSLAAILEAYDWNWAAAEREYRQAIRLNPHLASAHLWYGMFLRDQGRVREAMPELRKAAQLEPFSVMTSINLAHGYLVEGNYDAAAEQATRAVEKAPHLVTAYVILAKAHCARDQKVEAVSELARAHAYAGDNPHAVALLARAYAHHGKREESATLLRQLEDIATRRYVSPFDMGTVSLALGDEQRALDLLQEAFRQRSSGLIFLRDAKFSDLRRSSEFQSLMEKVRFAG